jgi:hypothetical protein
VKEAIFTAGRDLIGLDLRVVAILSSSDPFARTPGATGGRSASRSSRRIGAPRAEPIASTVAIAVAIACGSSGCG